jgi:hypothetical protein
MASKTTPAAITPANLLRLSHGSLPDTKVLYGVLTPAFDLIAVRENDPVAGNAPRNGPRTFDTPIAIISCDGLIV